MADTSTAQIKEIGVVGAGQMGAGIAQVFACAGFRTYLCDSTQDALEKGYLGITKRLERLVEKEKITIAYKDQALEKLQKVSNVRELATCDVVIEAIIEDTSIKGKLFRELDSACKREAILATNTSSISITKLAATTKRPDRVIGLHFMNPVPLMKLVEIIRGLQTSDETYKRSLDLVSAIQKTPVTAHHDYPGFVVNRILIPMINEACFVLQEGIASVEEVDTAMKLGTNVPMGPLELADFVGLDTVLAITRIFHNELGDDKYRPCPLLVKYVEAGWIGKKAGRGFYQY